MNKSYNYKDFRIEILYEDSDIAILNKPSGLLTHKKNEFDESPSLQDSLKDQFTIDDGENFKEGIVHRLDKDTSGIIVITKNLISKNKFREMFKKRNIKKNYLAFAYGVLNQNNIEINKNIDLNDVYLINENQYQQKFIHDNKAIFQIKDIETNKVLKEIVIEKN